MDLLLTYVLPAIGLLSTGLGVVAIGIQMFRGDRRPEAGGWRLESEDRRPEAGGRRPEVGGRRSKAGDQKLESRDHEEHDRG